MKNSAPSSMNADATTGGPARCPCPASPGTSGNPSLFIGDIPRTLNPVRRIARIKDVFIFV